MVNYNQRTQEEIDLTNFYLDKWDKILYSTQPVDRAKAEKSILGAYHHIGLSAPEILFLTSPSPAQVSLLISKLKSKNRRGTIALKRWLIDRLAGIVQRNNIRLDLLSKMRVPTLSFRGEKIQDLCNVLYESEIYNLYEYKISKSEELVLDLWMYDLYVDNVNNDFDIEIWNTLKSLCEECPYLLAGDEFCVIIERPRELCLDRELQPHAEGKAAIQFADGYEIYCNHGISIPAKYGRIHSSYWQAEWIFSEVIDPTFKDIDYQEELKTVLLLGIGCKNFCEQLSEPPEYYWLIDYKKRQPQSTDYAFDHVIFKWLEFHCGDDIDWFDYKGNGSRASWVKDCNDKKEIVKSSPLNMPEELKNFYIMYEGDYRLAPGLKVYPSKEVITDLATKSIDYPIIRLFHGDRNELYYMRYEDTEKIFSNVYCKLPDKEPTIYAECLTSWIAAIAQCYQEGAYYIAINPESGERKIEQDLDKVEPIFEKFNPNQIDAWRSIWKET
jgi:hypothetical protein